MNKLSILVLSGLISIGIVGCNTNEESEESNVATEAVEIEVVDGQEVEGNIEDEDADEEIGNKEVATDDEHHHDEVPYKWAASYQLDKGTYTLNFSKNEFDDESMLIGFLLENRNITDLEHHAAHMMEVDVASISESEEFEAKHEYAYKLLLNETATQFQFTVSESGQYRIFTEHHPEEFNMKIISESSAEMSAESPKDYDGHSHSHEHSH